MNITHDVIVIGLGAMGSATLYQLASRGVRALGIEQFSIPHDKGSYHGQTRLIRQAYYEHPDYVPLLRRATSLWTELETAANAKLLHNTGVLYVGPPDSPFIDRSRHAADLYGIPYEMLDRAALAKRYPQFTVPADHQAMYEHTGGFLMSEQCVSAHVDLAMRRGATVLGNTKVTGWSADANGVTVTTDRGTHRADKLVIAGGAWSDRLVTDLGVPLRVTRQVLAWVQPIRPELFTLGILPAWAIDPGDGAIHYGFPMLAGVPGFKLAHHYMGAEVNPDTIIREPLPGDEETVRSCLTQHLPDADGPLTSLRVCMYTNSPDEHFIIDRHPKHDRVSVACGFSGHGFKFASVIGEALADMAMTGGTELPIGFLGLKRFGR